MGDRAIIHFQNGDQIGPAIYLHWGGDGVRQLLLDTLARMAGRENDVSYTTARCIGLAHERTEGNLSLGTWSAPAGGETAILSPDYSHGDAGVFLVDISGGWKVRHHGGYGFGYRSRMGGVQLLPWEAPKARASKV